MKSASITRHGDRLASLPANPGRRAAAHHALPSVAVLANRKPREENRVNLNLTGHHLEITPAIRAYVVNKLDRVARHFDHVIDVNVVLSVDKLRQIVEANVHVRGKEIHAESIDPDMYAAIDALADKLDRQVVKHKEKLKDHRADATALPGTGGADGTGAE
jgi:putative sigma-54 modulation protein